MDLKNIITTIRILLPWTLLYSIPKLMNFKTMQYFDRLIFPFVFIAILIQFYSFIQGEYLVDFFKGTTQLKSQFLLVSKETTSRVASSPFIVFYSLIKALYYYYTAYEKKTFSNKYLIDYSKSLFIISNKDDNDSIILN